MLTIKGKAIDRLNRVAPFGFLVGVGFVALSGQVSAATISSTFEVDDEGWTSINGAVVQHQDTGGNPGGFVQFVDSSSLGYSAVAPAKFVGDLTAFDRGSFSFDYKVIQNTPPTNERTGTVRIFDNAGRLATADLVPPLASADPTDWNTYSLPLIAPLWGITDPTEWHALLSDVAYIDIFVEPGSFPDISALDNVIMSPVPIPAAAWLLPTALGVLGYLGSRKGTN